MARNKKTEESPAPVTASATEVVATLVRAKDGPPAGFTPVSFGPALGKDGDMVCGKYLGRGEDRDVKRGRKTDKVSMYRIHDDERGQIEIMGGAQMDAFFATVKIGLKVWIRRDGQGKTSQGNKVNLYSFAIQG